MSRLSYRLLILGFSGFLAACAIGPRPAEVGTKDASKSFSTVVVEAAHGGKDNGAYRKLGGDEKITKLEVDTPLARKMHYSALRIVMACSAHVFVPPVERVGIE